LIIDAHAHVGPYIPDERWRKALGVHPHCTGEDYLAAMDRAGVNVGVSVGRMDRNLEYQQEMQTRWPHRIVSLALVNPRVPDSVERLRDAVEHRGLRGLKLHGLRHQFSNANHVLLDPLIDICQRHGLPVVIHTMGDHPFTTPLQTEELARRWPQVTFLMAHGGTELTADEGLRVAQRTPNIVIDTSHTPTSWITKFVEVLGPDRVVMGSDWPWWRLEVAVKAHEIAITDPEHRAWVMGKTAARIFGVVEPGTPR
jgi:predicted TIM-barrel fold metal-dependent hydrolase